jgi:hypothetical protein
MGANHLSDIDEILLIKSGIISKFVGINHRNSIYQIQTYECAKRGIDREIVKNY